MELDPGDLSSSLGEWSIVRLPSRPRVARGALRVLRKLDRYRSRPFRLFSTTPDDLAYKVAASLGRFLTTINIKDQLEKISPSNGVSTEQERDQVSRRAARLEALVRGAKVMIINDDPLDMKTVVNLLEELQINVKIAATSEEALSTIDRGSYDVIISDMRRGGIADESLRLLKVLRQNGNMTPTIFSVGRYEPQLGTPHTHLASPIVSTNC